jgi:hypothetical protein
MRAKSPKSFSMDENILLGVCGLYCGARDHYRVYTSEGAYLQGRRPIGGRKLEHVDQTCSPASCRNCTVLECARRRGALHCGLCSEYSCLQLKAFQADVVAPLVYHVQPTSRTGGVVLPVLSARQNENVDLSSQQTMIFR